MHFTELCLVFLVALIVLGPERLTRLALSMGRWLAKLRIFASSLIKEMNRQFNNPHD